MPLTPGQRLGPYEVISPAGAGGMGEVYRATDTVLKRTVALKVLPASVADDAERLARFRREAELLAALNHPHIAGIHGVETADGANALVMEFVEGPTLADRLAGGPLPLDEVVPIATQIADALEAAHEQGIIHRDLKPANIKVRADGTVKVLDFGLAKAMDRIGAAEATPYSAANSPTMTSPAMTGMGVILGTAAYMSPEQAKGRAVDRRADIWAFGVVLYEMLTGRRAFEGEDVSDLLVAVLSKDVDWTALPAGTPTHVRTLVARCLVKDPKNRLRDIGEARLLLTGQAFVSRPDESASTAASPSRPWMVPMLAVALAAALVAIATLLWRDDGGLAAPATHVSLTFLDVPQPQKGRPIPSLAVSPDGRNIVYTAVGPEGNQLWIRSLDNFSATPIPGTARSRAAVYSPDGRWIAYQGAASAIMRISTTFDRPETVAAGEGAFVSGLTWTDRDEIVYTSAAALWRVAASGGTPVKVADGDLSYPDALPGGTAVLATASNDRARRSDELTIVRVDLTTGAVTPVIEGGKYGRWVPTGHLVFVRGNNLVAAAYDAATGTVGEDRVTVAEDLFMDPAASSGCHAVSAAGILVFCPGLGIDFERTFVTIDPTRAGSPPEPLVTDARYYSPWFSASQNGRYLAAVERGWTDRIVIHDLERKTSFYLTSGNVSTSQTNPVWQSDGRSVAFLQDTAMLRAEVRDGGATAETLIDDIGPLRTLFDNTPDGRSWLVGARFGGGDVEQMTPGTPPVSETVAARVVSATYSRDGRWLALASGRSGRQEVYVAPAAEPERITRVSVEGGSSPTWAPDNRLYFVGPGTGTVDSPLMAATIGGGGREPVVGRPTQLTTLRRVEPGVSLSVLPDGRIVVLQGSPMTDSTELRLILNWFDDLRRRVPTR